MQSVPITTKVVILNPVHGEVLSLQHYVMKFVNDSFIGGGNLSMQRKPLTCCKSLTNFIT
jgi:hypothetical protein